MEPKVGTGARLYIWIFVVFVLLIGVAASLLLLSDNGNDYSIEVVGKDSIINTFQFSGSVQPVSRAELSTEVSGRIVSIPVKVGDKVSAGQGLIILNSKDAESRFRKDEANLALEVAKLDDLLRGTRGEEITIQESKVEKAKLAYQNNEQILVDTILGSYSVVENAVRNKVDQLFDNANSINPTIIFNSQYVGRDTELEGDRSKITELLNQWNTDLNDLRSLGLASNSRLASIMKLLYRSSAASVLLALSDNIDFDERIRQSRKNLNTVKIFLDDTAFLVNGLTAGTYSLATINGWKTDVDAARTDIISELSNLSTAEKNYKDSKTAFQVESEELALLNAGSTKEDIAAQEAKVEVARQQLSESEINLAKYTLRSPFTGVFVGKNIEVGELAKANTVVATVSSLSSFEIDADISEIDIGGVEEGMKANVTLDSFPGEVFVATVTDIDPAETLVNNIPSYGVTLVFDRNDERIRSGMTANILLETTLKRGVLVINARALIIRDGDFFVKKELNGVLVDQEVVTGLRDSRGSVEVVDGLEEGDKVQVRS